MNTADIISRIVSHAAATGLFERVNSHEPKNAPGRGLSCAVWAQEIGRSQGDSGLASTTARLEFSVRIYKNMVSEPQDEIDPHIVHAVDVLLTAYAADFTLGATIQNVDLLGMAGTALGAQAGYLNVSGTMYRVMTITLPLIVTDAWTQTA